MKFSTGSTIPRWTIYGSVCDQGTGQWVLQEIKRFQRMVDYCPCRYWLLSRSSLETPPACPLDADQVICAGHPQWIFICFFTCMIRKTLAWQSPFSELCVKKESIRLERWSLTTVQRTLTSYIKIERKNTHKKQHMMERSSKPGSQAGTLPHCNDTHCQQVTGVLHRSRWKK